MMIISPQTVSPEINTMESRHGIAAAEKDRSARAIDGANGIDDGAGSIDGGAKSMEGDPEESKGSEADGSAFAKILSGLLKNNQDPVPPSGIEAGGHPGPERVSPERSSSESSGPKKAGGKGFPEKIRPQNDEEKGAPAGSVSRSELLEKFPELDEEVLLNAENLLLSGLNEEQQAASLEEGAMALAGGESLPSDEELAALESFFGPRGAGKADGAEDPNETLAREAAEAAARAAEEGGSLKDGKGRDRKGFRGIVDDVNSVQRSLEKDSPFTGTRKQALVDAEGDRKSRLGEAKNRDKRRDRLNVEVRDLRTQGEGAQTVRETGHADEARPLSGSGETELTVELHQDKRGSEAASAGGEKTASQAFEDILARELHQNLNGDIVRHASVVLKDGGEGTIKLSLRPESLGNVKIRLEMADNKITGHIIVESDEALRAFEREVSSLEQAFKESGFDGADLEMSLASGNDGGAGQQWRGEEASPFFSERFAAELAASQYDALTERTDTPWAEMANGLKPGNGQISVNMLI
ncbi:hypothetical protein AGMMS50268_20190 [Spirochaetia bacterium]|nr:hypothetical protein AGMMS50268_20190 [Spirochaetia bacterium]